MSASAEHYPDERTKALMLLREKFAPEHIGKLPKVNCYDCTQANKNKPGTTCGRHLKQNCRVCGNYMTAGHMHVDYVGHAEVTDRFLDADLTWTWRPMAFTPQGLPLFDEHGGLWMYLTIGGVERIGYGDSAGKRGANAIKEAVGDALRNSGMRFGVALDQWAKSDLHADEHDGAEEAPVPASGQRLRLADDPNHISPGQVAMIDSLFGKREISGDAERGRIVAQIIGHPVSGVLQLTPAEASSVIQALTTGEITGAEQQTAAQ